MMTKFDSYDLAWLKRWCDHLDSGSTECGELVISVQVIDGDGEIVGTFEPRNEDHSEHVFNMGDD